MPDAPQKGHLKPPLQRLADALLGLLQTRLELAALELQEQKLRLLNLVGWLAVMVVFGAMALATVTVGIALFVWKWAGEGGLALLALAYGVVAFTVFLYVRKRVRRDPKPFSETIEEFKRDREWLAGRN